MLHSTSYPTPLRPSIVLKQRVGAAGWALGRGGWQLATESSSKPIDNSLYPTYTMLETPASVSTCMFIISIAGGVKLIGYFNF